MPRRKSLKKQIVAPSTRDSYLSSLPLHYSSDVIASILSTGREGHLDEQNELFDVMEDSWERLRSNLGKIKGAISRLPFNVQPWVEKGSEPTASATEKAKFVEHVLHEQKAKTWENELNFRGSIFELLDAVARGISVLEVEWENQDGFIVPSKTSKVPWSALGFESVSTALMDADSKADPYALRLYPDPDRQNSKRFTDYPHKFLVGVYRGKSGHLGEAANLRALAHHWYARMLAWEWLLQRGETYGLPYRWANYPAAADASLIAELQNALENFGTNGWAAFPEGTSMNLIQGSVPGVAGINEPVERLITLADRACDLTFLGQTLTTTEGQSGSYALGNVHRDVELDLFEAYADYISDVFSNQLIPSIVELNFGNTEELPYLVPEIKRPERDNALAERDEMLFMRMGLPVEKQWLYERHNVPQPSANVDPSEMYDPLPPYLTDRRKAAERQDQQNEKSNELLQLP